MDAAVLAGMAKWPNVPAVFGWLRLDARGQWWLRDSRLEHDGMAEFFNRNYSRDAHGRYYVQNGPQKVYVALDKAPFVARLEADGWRTVPYTEDDHSRTVYLTPAGELYLEIGGELALVDDRDLPAICRAFPADWDGSPARLPATLLLAGRSLPLIAIEPAALLARYGVDCCPVAR